MSEIGVEDVSAFALSVTVISSETGFFTAFPCSGGQPGTSSVNARPGIPTPNLVVGVPDDDGMLCLFSQNGGNVVIDVSGWWADGPNRFTPIEPTRAYDTRTLDNPDKLPANSVSDVEIAGVVVPDDAVSVTLNVAAVAPETDGFLVVYPCGFPVPLASNLNFVAGERRAVSAIVDLGPRTDAAASGQAVRERQRRPPTSSSTSPGTTLHLHPPVPTSSSSRVADTRRRHPCRCSAGRALRSGYDAAVRPLRASIDRPDEAVAVVLNVVAVQCRPRLRSCRSRRAPPDRRPRRRSTTT